MSRIGGDICPYTWNPSFSELSAARPVTQVSAMSVSVKTQSEEQTGNENNPKNLRHISTGNKYKYVELTRESSAPGQDQF